MRFALLILGALALIAGVIWTLQGLDVLGGSFMSGNATWAVIGPVVAVLGLVLFWLGFRRERPRRDA